MGELNPSGSAPDPLQPIQPPVNAIPPEKNPTAKSAEPPIHPPAAPEIHPSPEGDEYRCKCRPDQTPWWKWCIEGSAILVGIYVAFVYTSQLGQMIKSNELTRQTLEITQQSSVTIGRKDGVVAEFITTKNPKDDIGIVMYFQNSGHMPAARFNWGMYPQPTIIKPFRQAGLLSHMTRTRNRKTNQISQNGGLDTIGGDSLFVANLGRVRPEQLSKENDLQIDGMFEYCDELGTYSCQQFILQYLREPYNRFWVMLQSDCPVFQYANQRADPDIDYLPVCKTPGEHAQERKDAEDLWDKNQKELKKMMEETKRKAGIPP